MKNFGIQLLTNIQIGGKILGNNKARRLTLSPVGCRLHGSILRYISRFSVVGQCCAQTVISSAFFIDNFGYGGAYQLATRNFSSMRKFEERSCGSSARTAHS